MEVAHTVDGRADSKYAVAVIPIIAKEERCPSKRLGSVGPPHLCCEKIDPIPRRGEDLYRAQTQTSCAQQKKSNRPEENLRIAAFFPSEVKATSKRQLHAHASPPQD